jgi:mRNA guanylyltransferase
LPLPSDPTFQSFHQRTILDGELVLDRVGAALVPRFMVFDCLILDGELLVQKSFDRRIGRVHQFVHKPLTKCIEKFPEEQRFFPFDVIPKPMEKPYAIENVFIQLADLPHGNDGLVFTAKGAVYSFGTDEMIIKWKPPEENTIDFRLHVGDFPTQPTTDKPETPEDADRPADPQADKPMDDQPIAGKPEDPTGDTPMADKAAPRPDLPKAVEIDWDAKPVLSLLVFWGKGDYRRLASLYCTDDDWRNLTRHREKLDGRIIECYIDDQNRWRYKKEEDGSPRFRDDKTEANHSSTVQKIMASIDDGVSKKDLCKAQSLIYQAWKDRHPEEERLARAEQINQTAKALQNAQQQQQAQKHSGAADENPLPPQKTEEPPKYRWNFTSDPSRTFDQILSGKVPPNLRNVLDHYLNFGNLPKASRDSLRRMLQVAIETHPEPTSETPPEPPSQTVPKAAPKAASKAAPKAASKAPPIPASKTTPKSAPKPASESTKTNPLPAQPALKTASKPTLKAGPPTAPTSNPKTDPKAAPETDARTALETTPKATPQTAPNDTPETALETTPHTSLKPTPEAASQTPDKTSQTVPQTIPDAALKTTPKTAPKTGPKTAPKTAPQTTPKLAPKMSPQTSPETAPKLAPLPPLAPKLAPMPPQVAFPASVHVDPTVDPLAAPPAPPAYLQPHIQGLQMAPTSPQAARHMARPGPPQPRQAPLPITFVGVPVPPPGAYQMAGPGSPQNASPVSPVHSHQVYPRPPHQVPPPPISPNATFIHQNPQADGAGKKPRGRPKGSRKRSLDTAIGSNRSLQPAPKRTPNAHLKGNTQASPPGVPNAPPIQSPNFMQPDPAGNASVLQANPSSHYPGYGRGPSKGSLESILQPSAPAANLPPQGYRQPENLPRAPVNYQPGGQRYPPTAPGANRPDAPGDLPTAPANYRPIAPGNPLSPTGYRNPRASLDNILQRPGRGSLGSILQTSPTSASPPGSLERMRAQPGSPAQAHHRKASLESILLQSPTVGSASPTAGGFGGPHPYPPSQKSPKASLSMLLHPNEDGGSPLQSRAPPPPLSQGPLRGSPLQGRAPPPQPPLPQGPQRGSPLEGRAPPPLSQGPLRGSPLESRPPPPPPRVPPQGSPLESRAPPLQQQQQQRQGPPQGSPQGNAPRAPYGGSPTGKGKSDIHKLLQ